MLKSLHIENYAIIKEVHLEFDRSLNIITGETGAGKSIIMGALSLIMGQRADTSVLYESDVKCIVEGVFSHYPEEINHLLEEADYDLYDELIIRREIAASGKSRAFVNDSPARLDLLVGLAERLVDLNAQFEMTAIRQSSFQMEMIDSLSGNASSLAQYQSDYKIFKAYKKELDALHEKEKSQLKEIEFIRFQLDELSDAALESGEGTALEAEKKILSESESLKLLVEETRYTAELSDTAVSEQLRQLLYKWEKYAEISEKTAGIIELFGQLEDNLSRLVDMTDKVERSLDADPGRLDEIEERLDLIYGLERKHQVQNVDDLLEIQKQLEQKLEGFESDNTRASWLESEIQRLQSHLLEAARALSKARKSVFPKIENEVNKKLQLLSMSSATIKVDHTVREELDARGLDDIEFLFKANAGGSFQAIGKVASGGESARLMLALKSTVAHAMNLPTMIFDEIDSGVSGDVAGKMGQLLKGLAQNHQLICITHSPQVAARAVRHFFVHKEEVKKRTITHVSMLDGEERVTEIAKMLSGDPPTVFALENAKELMDIPG